jgi:hypothetical protein
MAPRRFAQVELFISETLLPGRNLVGNRGAFISRELLT